MWHTALSAAAQTLHSLNHAVSCRPKPDTKKLGVLVADALAPPLSSGDNASLTHQP